MSRIYVAVDLETTGFHAERDAIIEIGAVKFRLGAGADESPVVATWSSFVNPGRPIPYRISRLTGITQADVQRAPRLNSVCEELAAFVGNYPVVGHNIAFDLRFLHRHNCLVGNASIDTFELASILLPKAPRYSLDQLSRHLGLTLQSHHRALDDAMAAQQLLSRLWDVACQLPADVLTALNHVAGRSQWPLRSFFAAVSRAQQGATPVAPTKGMPPLPALALAPLPEPPPVPQYTPPPTPRATERRAALLEGDGVLSQHFADFRRRPQQLEMLEGVVRAFNEQTPLLVEAGTGTGKSLAYLLPAIFQAQATNRPVVISTNTINLQDQIFDRDMPLLRQALNLGDDFRTLRLKGSRNYLCPRRLERFMRRAAFSEVEARALARVLVWLPQTETGDRSEIAVQSDEETVWEAIGAETTLCRPEQCDMGRCFFQRARRLAQFSHLLIVNHALLLTDMTLPGMRILPDHQYLIIDEAHHLEERATEQFSVSLSRNKLISLLNRLHDDHGRRPTGLIPSIGSQAEGRQSAAAKEIRRQVGLLGREVQELRREVEGLFETIPDALERWTPEGNEEYDAQIAIKPDVRASGAWRRVQRAAENMVAPLDRLTHALMELEQQLKNDPAGSIELTEELAHVQRALIHASAACWRALVAPEANDICWITLQAGEEQRHSDIILHHAPLTIGALLAEHLFETHSSVVMTSATLQSESSFEYIRDRLGVPRHCRELSLGAPFDYRQAALVYVPTDLPEPNSPNYAQTLHRALIDLARATQGRMLVLLTSKSQLRATYRAISDPLANDDIVVLGQYMDGGRHQLLERFKHARRAILLGTQSFWEGVDVPGPALSCLVIARLPFPVPTEPIFAARAESYDDHFNQFVVPQTVLRFRQGFGRLIRTEHDRGIVALLDSRVVTKHYGSAFLNSLPAADIRHGPFRDLPPLAERWLSGDLPDMAHAAFAAQEQDEWS